MASPTTRSRTGLFLSYRESSVRPTRFSRARVARYDEPDIPDDEHQGLIQHVAVDVSLPPKWSLSPPPSPSRVHLRPQGRPL